MAKKRVVVTIRMQVPAGQATPAAVGSSLGPHGVSSPQFCQQFNEATKNIDDGMPVPVDISVYADRTFSFTTKTPPASALIRKALNLEKGSSQPNRDKVGELSQQMLRQIAQSKIADLNANDIEAAMKIVAGTARSMGVTVEAQ